MMSAVWINKFLLRTCRYYSAVASRKTITHSINDPEIERLLLNLEEDATADQDPFSINEITSVQELFEARVHLGHKSGMWDPAMKEYIYGTRGGIHIFDLSKTLAHLKLALNVAAHITYKNGVILFVNERSQFDRLAQETARDCGEFFVTPQWSEGLFTNSFKLLKTTRYPDLMIALSASKSIDAVKESAMCNVPIIAITDSNADPRLITYPIPGNDDTPTAVKLYCKLFSQVIKTAKLCREKDNNERKMAK